MLDRPFALHETWTCYGTWLPGDPRGYVSNTLPSEGGFIPKQNTPESPYAADDPHTRHRARALQAHPTTWLTAEQALCVAEALVKAARDRGWRIVRAAIMANHVHAVVMECPNNGPLVRRALKGVSHAALCKKTRKSRRWWTAGGSDRYKNDWPAIEAAVHYVANQEGILAGIDDMRVFVPA